MSVRWPAAALALFVAAGASGYTRSTATGSMQGTPLFRPDADNIELSVADNVEAGLLNAEGRLFITPESDPLGALQAAIDVWDRAPDSSARFAPLTPTQARNDPDDGRHVFVFEDTPEIRSFTQGALAVTRMVFLADGTLEDTDIVFNPDVSPGNNQIPFSTDQLPASFDLQGAATHEIGHALGANHTAVIGAAMFHDAGQGETFRRHLSTDEHAFLREAYPADGADANLGEIFGAATVNGAPATGVHVTVVDTFTGVMIGALTDLDDGTYRIRVPAVPRGRYFAYMEPLDGPVRPANIQIIDQSKFNTSVRTRFVGGNGNPRILDVVPGRSARGDVALEDGVSALDIEMIGVGPAASPGVIDHLTDGPVRLIAGEAIDVILSGPGLDATVGETDIRLLGRGLKLRVGSLMVDPEITVNGGPVIRFTVDVEELESRWLGSVAVTKGVAATAYSGAFVIEPPGPQFSNAGVVNGASFLGGPIAPGAIISIFGTGLGPATGVAVTGFDPATGGLPTELGGVEVFFNGVAAPMFFASDEQLNLQSPFEIADRGVARIVIRVNGQESLPVSAGVGLASPGIFKAADSTQAIVLNEDGTVNTPENPAGRGEFITIFATGQGAIQPPIATGQPANADPLSLAGPTQVTIGGVAAPGVLFSGMAPDLVGLWQINVRVPESLEPGSAISIVIAAHGLSSQPGVTISVR